jgi:hypothetical protein
VGIFASQPSTETKNTKSIDVQALEIFLDERVYLCCPVLFNAGMLETTARITTELPEKRDALVDLYAPRPKTL